MVTQYRCVHCDSDDKVTRRALIEDFRSNPATSDVANFMKKGIYTVGFPHKEKTLPAIYEALSDNMENEVEQLHDLIANSYATVLSKELYDPSWWICLDQLQNCNAVSYVACLGCCVSMYNVIHFKFYQFKLLGPTTSVLVTGVGGVSWA